jgi:hypothetical protein
MQRLYTRTAMPTFWLVNNDSFHPAESKSSALAFVSMKKGRLTARQGAAGQGSAGLPSTRATGLKRKAAAFCIRIGGRAR